MDTMPLHPALVHLPIGLAFLLPLLGFGVLFAIVRGWLPRTAWAIVVIVSGLALGTALAARRTGEQDEDRVEQLVAQRLIHDHELAANWFTGGLALVTLLAGAVFFLRREVAFRTASGAISLLYFWVLAMGLMTGRHGGELVYLHGAANVTRPIAAPGTVPTAPPAPGERHEAEHKD